MTTADRPSAPAAQRTESSKTQYVDAPEDLRDLEKGDPEKRADSSDDAAGTEHNEKNDKQESKYTADGKRIITEDECYDKLGYSWSWQKRWWLLSVIFAVQVSMNFNTSVYPNAVMGLTQDFPISEQGARVGQMIFLVLYAFGSELWAPWSEEFGRWPILQLSLFLVNIWQIPAALAPNFGTIVVARALGGLSSAGGSVTIGMVADLWEPDDQQYAIAFVVLSSVLGTSIGPVIGGPIEKYLGWHWIFWIQLIFGGAVQVLHFFTPESRSTIIMDREAKRLRKSGQDSNVYGPDEVKSPRLDIKEFGVIWIRPFEMFFREPIVLCLSLLSGFSDALIFTFQEGFMLVYEQWEFGTLQQAWAFLPIVIGYFIAYATYFPWIARDNHLRKTKGSDALPPERRLKWLLYLAPLETIGLFGFAWTSLGPPRVHWIAPMIFSVLVAIANYAIYMSTIDYMVASYGIYSASATGGNALARDFLAGIAAMYASPLYSNIDPQGYHLEYASTILACIAVVVTIPIYVFYWKGPIIREKSKFAQGLADDRAKNKGRRVSQAEPEQLQPQNL